MEPVRPLHDIFSGLARGPAEPGDALRAGGHGELPDALVAEAIVSYADTAPAEVAERLAPFVTGHGPVPHEAGADLADGLQLLASAPVEPATGDSAPEDPLDLAFGEGTGGAEATGLDPTEAEAEVAAEVADLAIGADIPGTESDSAGPDPADLFPMPGPAGPEDTEDTDEPDHDLGEG